MSDLNGVRGRVRNAARRVVSKLQAFPRWPIAILLCAVLLPALILLFPVSQAAIDIDAVSEELRFRTTGPSLLVGDGLKIESLNYVGDGQLHSTAKFPDQLKDALAIRSDKGSARVRVIELNDEAEVVLAWLDRFGVSLTISGGKPRVEVDVTGAATINGQPNIIDQDVTFTLTGSQGPMTLMLRGSTLADPKPLLRPNLPISEASYWARNPGQGSVGQKSAFSQSTIASGTLFLSDLKDDKRTLRPYEELTVGGLNGRLRSVELRKNGVRSFISGTASTVETQSASGTLELKPERYRSWAARLDTFWLALASALYVFGSLLAVAHWAGWRLSSGADHA